MNWEVEGAGAAATADTCRPAALPLLARMYCLPPMETMEDGVAVTVDGDPPDELTTILQEILNNESKLVDFVPVHQLSHDIFHISGPF